MHRRYALTLGAMLACVDSGTRDNSFAKAVAPDRRDTPPSRRGSAASGPPLSLAVVRAQAASGLRDSSGHSTLKRVSCSPVSSSSARTASDGLRCPTPRTLGLGSRAVRYVTLSTSVYGRPVMYVDRHRGPAAEPLRGYRRTRLSGCRRMTVPSCARTERSAERRAAADESATVAIRATFPACARQRAFASQATVDTL